MNMEAKDAKTPDLIPLSEEARDAAVQDLHKRGGTFFTWEQLQQWIRHFGPHATIEDVQKVVKNKNDQEPQR